MAVLLLWLEGHAETAATQPMQPAPHEAPENAAPHGEASEDYGAVISPWDNPPDIIGLNDIVFQPETGPIDVEESFVKDAVTPQDVEKLRDFEYLTRQFFMSDANTGLLPSDINVDAFMQADLTIDMAEPGPKILIFHTHSTEMFSDSIIRETAYATDPMEGVMGVGRELAKILTERYGIEVLHHTGRYDIVNGKAQISGAYERMETPLRQLLEDNPSIQLAIDLHRDGLREGVPPMLTDINGNPAARIMFVNGLSRTRRGDVSAPVPWLENPYVTENLNLSFRMQLHANELYPGFTRKVYLKPYRYSLHLLPKTLLVEVGAQNNTKQEAYNAMAPLAEILAQTAFPQGAYDRRE
jgi:stage II sporulation protein P